MKKAKIISALLTAIMIVAMLGSIAFADGPMDLITPGADGVYYEKFQNIGTKILGYIQWLGYAIAVGMLIWCGVKYMMSGATEKADVKKTLLPYFIGAICVGGATGISQIILNIGNNGLS